MAKIDNFSKELNAELKLYSKELTEEMAQIVMEEAKTMTKTLQAESPKRTGKYAKGWTSKKMSQSSNSISVLVYNKNKPQLTHLLEFGHVLSTGGRSKAISHIKKAQDVAEKRVIERIERVVK